MNPLTVTLTGPRGCLLLLPTRPSSLFRQPAIVPQGLIAGVLEAGQDIPKEYFEAILRKACPLTNTMIEPDEIAQVCYK